MSEQSCDLCDDESDLLETAVIVTAGGDNLAERTWLLCPRCRAGLVETVDTFGEGES